MRVQCPKHSAYRGINAPRDKDCPWCAEIKLLRDTPAESRLQFYSRQGLCGLIERLVLKVAVRVTSVGEEIMEYIEWGTGDHGHAPADRFVKVANLTNHQP